MITDPTLLNLKPGEEALVESWPPAESKNRSGYETS